MLTSKHTSTAAQRMFHVATRVAIREGKPDAAYHHARQLAHAARIAQPEPELTILDARRSNGNLYTFMRQQYARNAQGLQQMLTKAEQTRRKVNGYTAEQLRAKVEEYRGYAVLDDAGMEAHLQTIYARVRATVGGL